MNPLSIPRSKRRPLADSSMQLQQQLGMKAISGDLFENEKYRVERVSDPDYPWLLTRKETGDQQRLASLIEAVGVLKREAANANRK